MTLTRVEHRTPSIRSVSDIEAVVAILHFEQNFLPLLLAMATRGVIADKWSMRVLWACAIGSAVSLYMVAVERQKQNRQKMLAMELGEINEDV